MALNGNIFEYVATQNVQSSNLRLQTKCSINLHKNSSRITSFLERYQLSNIFVSCFVVPPILTNWRVILNKYAFCRKIFGRYNFCENIWNLRKSSPQTNTKRYVEIVQFSTKTIYFVGYHRVTRSQRLFLRCFRTICFEVGAVEVYTIQDEQKLLDIWLLLKKPLDVRW